jgi:hypothetical protein
MVLNLLGGAAIGFLLFVAIRWISRQSRVLGYVVAAGMLARAAVGLILFWISYLELPILRSLQFGEGFWTLMGDARGYYRTAIAGVQEGMHVIQPGMSSPFYTKTLVVWMHVVGISPADGLLLNTCFYVAICTVLTAAYRPTGEWRRDLPLLVALGSLSFSPVVLIHATQTLKEDLFIVLIVAVCLGAMLLFDAIVNRTGAALLAGIGRAAVVLALASYCIAGIRAYYSVIICATLALVLMGVGFTRRGRLLRVALAGTLVLGAMWYAYWLGAGPYYRPSPAEMARLTSALPWALERKPFWEVLGTAVTAVEGARTGFLLTGGATNIVLRRSDAAPPPEGLDIALRRASDGAPPPGRLRVILTGLGVVFVPISILKAASIVDFSGGRGLLPIADADTVVMDASLVTLLILVYRRRSDIGDRWTLLVFGLALSLITSVLLGYVVTNLGTLFRMRYLVAAPVWMLVLTLAPRPAAKVIRPLTNASRVGS